MTHLAAALVLKLAPFIQRGRLEILCGASDGVDGRSKSGGVYFGPNEASHVHDWDLFRLRLRQSLRDKNTALCFEPLHALIPSFYSGTNLQDVAMVRVRGAYRI